MITVFLKIVSVFFIIFLGAVVRRRDIIDAHSTRQLAKLMIHALYPALIYSTIVRQFTMRGILENLSLPTGALVIMLVGFMVGRAAAALMKLDRTSDTGRTFLLQCTMNNYSFLPMLLALMFWKEKGMALVIFSTLGSEVGVWTLGIYSLTGRKLNARVLKNLINMPIFAIAGAMLTLWLRSQFSFAEGGLATEGGEIALATLELVGQATIPISMIVAGSRMEALRAEHLFSFRIMLLSFLRLILIPVATVAILMMLPLDKTIEQVLVLVAVMPCAITSVTLCEVYDKDSHFAASSVLMTHVLALVTIPVWLKLLEVSS